MSTGSINSFNACFSANSNQWLKHQMKEIQGKSYCNSLISPESLPLFTEARSEERKTILLKTDSRECLWNVAKIAFFKPGASWLSASATTSKNFMVGLNVSGTVKITYNTSCPMTLLSVDPSHKIAIKFTKCNFFFTFPSNKYSEIPKMKFLQAF